VILVDPPHVPSRGRWWSHVASDVSFEELHDFAAGVGIPARGFDRDHYDIPEELYEAVVSSGALPVPSRELVARLRSAGLRRRKTSRLSPPATPGAAAPR
jgi:hypothetical protein